MRLTSTVGGSQATRSSNEEVLAASRKTKSVFPSRLAISSGSLGGTPPFFPVERKTGGKQYRVAAGEKIKVEQIPADVGTEISLDQVLMVGAGENVKVGNPLVKGATVTAKVVSHGRHPKVKIFKLRRRKHYQKHQGHRQNYTELEISSINA